ncbi:TPA: PA0069 family radical SAM protein [Stenotrophomonas maltophilia]|uniref:PA0069 family radical SAM protein n=1 Tax=Stenotrophomonas TaxID=40323 RepID=UPI00066C304D|nr:PA0069 family radical SAM protein [Stenotrophomonas maltophilia]MBH1464307.1 PA0069 family radical SAM protein [Stenotrophomonas maltophilia]MBH1615106.1 PA0069 family radical SAM protein [Stenotrophomonas maltophilia]MBH1698454.1 PA0069 family radical SAM protein [Stenotrophomonas maltophilia]MBH1712684.1 PA0069 family radical SAM protein [Stenotrophomonas maltophilia]MBN5040957.1 PA0069 family radical SAM protein [Stenotrophomonas maltophilia]
MEQDARKAQVPLKGRGAASRVPSRFDTTETVGVDDGWESVYHEMEDTPRLITQVQEERARAVISRNSSPDVGFSASVNPYRGCEHGCVYCFARPSHSYLSLSPGLDFETRLFAKTNAPERLRAEISKSNYKCAPIALGINTDGYQPIERNYQITRQCLEVLADAKHPVSFVTKSALITKDIDLLASMAKDRLVTVYFSVTTLDRKLSAELEPRAAAPHARLRAMNQLHEAGVPVGVLIAPVIPMITDHDLEAILQAAHEHGARAAGYVLLRLPNEIKDIWREWLELHYPDRAAHVLSLMRQMHGGKEYDASFGTRMSGTGPVADLIRKRFEKKHRELGFTRLPALATHLFQPPQEKSPQGQLF